MHRFLGFTLASIVSAYVAHASIGCGPGDDCTVTATCAVESGGGGSGAADPQGGGPATGGGGAAPGELGFPCDGAGECDSGFCVDGVCCEGACDGICEACDGSGTCAPQAPGTDPDDECAEGVCDGGGVCATGAYRWGKRFGDAQADELLGLDAGGMRIGMTGTYLGSPEFGLGPLSVPSTEVGAFAVELGLDGDATLSETVVDAGYANSGEGIDALDAAVGADGRLVICGGGGAGDVDFGGGSLSLGIADGFVGALSTSGGHIFSDVGGGYGTTVTRVAVTSAGETVVAGSTFDSGGSLGGATYAGGSALFVIKLSSSGTGLWSFDDVSGSIMVSAEALVVQDDGDVLIVGSTSGDVTFGSTPLPGSGARTFLLRLSADGDVLSAHAFGNATTRLLAVTAVGNDVVLGGAFSSAVDFGGPTLTAVSGEDLFLARVTEDGQHVWSERFGEGGDQSVTSLDVGADGALYAAGLYNGSLSFGVGGTSSGGGFLVKVHPSGQPVWSRDLAGGVTSVRVTGLEGGGAAVGGSFSGNVDLGGGVLTSAGMTDVFVAAFDP